MPVQLFLIIFSYYFICVYYIDLKKEFYKKIFNENKGCNILTKRVDIKDYQKPEIILIDDPAFDETGQGTSGMTSPGQGGNPPGQGGNPPGQGGNPPGQGGNPPGQGGNPPGQGGNPPGQGGNPPGQGGNPPGQGGKKN